MKKLLLSLLLVAVGHAVPAFADSYTLVTDASTLANGDEVILIGKNGDTYYAMSPTVSSNKIKSTTVTCLESSIDIDASTNIQRLVLESQSETPAKFAFKKKDGSDYIIGATNSTNTSYGTAPLYEEITISTTGDATIKIKSGDSSRFLRFYSTASDFRGYASESQSGTTAVCIYRLDGSADTGLGDIIVTTSDGQTITETNNDITLSTGQTITFSAKNSTQISVSINETEVASANNNNTVSWTANQSLDKSEVSVIATDGTTTKTFTFYLTVTEPVEPEHEIWTLVTSVDDLAEGGKYIIANNDGTYGMSNTNQGNYRPTTDVTVTDKNLLDPSDNVLRLTLEKDGVDYLWKTINYKNAEGEVLAADKQVYLNTLSGSNNYLYATNPQSGNENRRNTSVTFDDENVLITFVNAQYKTETNNRRIFYNSDRFATYSETNTSMGKVKLYKLLEPEMPVFDQIEDDASIVSVKSTKGDLHVWTLEYDKDGNLVKDNGEDVTASVLAKAPAADDNTWTNRVADENVAYNIDVPTTEGNYLTIRAKSVLNGIHSDELVKYVDASGNVISGIEAVAADDTNAPVEYFNLQGMRVNADQPGLYIRRQGSKVEKVSIR